MIVLLRQQLPCLALGAQPDLAGPPLGISVLCLPRVMLERHRLVADVLDFIDLVRGFNRATSASSSPG